MKCLRCKTNRAIKDKQYGYLPCLFCQETEQSQSKPRLGFEFTSDVIKDQRREYMADSLQPWPGNGVLSREYLEIYGTTGIEATQEQIDNAKYAYKSQKGWWNLKKTIKAQRYTKPKAKK